MPEGKRQATENKPDRPIPNLLSAFTCFGAKMSEMTELTRRLL